MRSIYLKKKINKNEKISIDHIKVARPGLSLHPKYFDKIIGLEIKKNLDRGDRILPKYIKGFSDQPLTNLIVPITAAKPTPAPTITTKVSLLLFKISYR